MRGSRKLTTAQREQHDERRVSLGHAIRRRREALGLTQKAVGDYIGLGDKTICAIERGIKLPQLLDLVEWAAVLRVDTGWFVEQMVVFAPPARRRPAVDQPNTEARP